MTTSRLFRVGFIVFIIGLAFYLPFANKFDNLAFPCLIVGIVLIISASLRSKPMPVDEESDEIPMLSCSDVIDKAKGLIPDKPWTVYIRESGPGSMQWEIFVYKMAHLGCLVYAQEEEQTYTRICVERVTEEQDAAYKRQLL